MYCEIVLPALLWPDDPARFISAAPALANLLARGTSTSAPSNSLENWLLDRFSLTTGGAAISLLGENAVAPDDDYWLRADPVHLSINRDRVVLLDASQLDIGAEEAKQLCDSLNEHFHGDGLSFIAPNPQRWYVKCATGHPLQTHPLSVVRGRRIDKFGFSGPGRGLWEGRLSEAQMLLHAHPVNEAREERDALAINSLWLWGGGHLPAAPTSPIQRIVANEGLPRGLAKLSGAEFLHNDQDVNWQVASHSTNSMLVVTDGLAVPAAYGDTDSWLSQLQAVEATWFAPALAALKQGKLKKSTLTILQSKATLTTAIGRADLFKFWRGKETLSNQLRAFHDQDH